MNFLLDTNVCSAHLRRPEGLSHRFFQHEGQLMIPTPVLGELYAGAYGHSDTDRILKLIADMLQEVRVMDFDAASAERFGKLRGSLMEPRADVPTVFLMIAAMALAHDLTLVTHDTAGFQAIPGLRVEDWLVN